MTLELIETEQLINELRRRYQILVVAASTNLDKERGLDLLSYQGHMLTVLGLVNVLHADIVQQYHEGLEDAHDRP